VSDITIEQLPWRGARKKLGAGTHVPRGVNKKGNAPTCCGMPAKSGFNAHGEPIWVCRTRCDKDLGPRGRGATSMKDRAVKLPPKPRASPAPGKYQGLAPSDIIRRVLAEVDDA
jgi:hypothetical protein